MKLLISAVLLFAVASIQGKSVLSSDDALENTHFLLFSGKHPNEAQELMIGDAAILNQVQYDITLQTIVFIHGTKMSGRDEKVLKMRDEYLARGDCNFISVDWEKLAAKDSSAVKQVGAVGDLTSQMITTLNKFGTSIDRFQLIGFGMGAHVAGKAANMVDFAFTRITGLDPVSQGFSMEDTENRLDTSDALSVDVIHTSSSSFSSAIGSVDFFVNGGVNQPGCRNKACSHDRAMDYFTESINSQVGFTATLCDSWKNFTKGVCHGSTTNLMGERVDESNEGVFYLATNKQSPFAMEQ